MRVKFEYAGTNATVTHLTVFVDVVTGTSRRVKAIRIPWGELTDRKILDEIDKQVRRELMAAWEGPREVGFDLPGID